MAKPGNGFALKWATDDNSVQEVVAKKPNKTRHRTSCFSSFEVEPSHSDVRCWLCVPGADLLKLTREDVIQICGPADGIRLFNALKGRWGGLSVTCHSRVTCSCSDISNVASPAQGGTPEANHLRLPGLSADAGAASQTRERRRCRQHVLRSVCEALLKYTISSDTRPWPQLISTPHYSCTYWQWSCVMIMTCKVKSKPATNTMLITPPALFPTFLLW